jgi:hypothetical protein
MLSQTCSQAERVLATAELWSFDVFALERATTGRPLSALAYFLMHKTGLMHEFAVDGRALIRCGH